MKRDNNAIDFIEQAKKVENFLDRMMPFGFSGVALIASTDEIYLNKGYGYSNYEKQVSMNENMVLSIGSIAKQFTSTLVMRLVDEDKLLPSDPLKNFFEDVPNDKMEITLHQLMTHTSGLPGDLEGLGDFDYMPTEQFLDKLFTSPLNSKPGEQFAYSNVGYSLAAMIIEKVVGKNYIEYLLETLASVGIEQAGWFGDQRWNDENSVYYYTDGKNNKGMQHWNGSTPEQPLWAILGNGGVCISAKNLYRWMRTVMSRDFLSDSSRNQLFTAELNDYAYGWDVLETENGTIYEHDGGNHLGVNAVAKYLKDQDIYIVLLNNVSDNGFGAAFKVRDSITEIMQGEEPHYPPEVNVHGPAEQSMRFLGENNGISLVQDPIGRYTVNIWGQEVLNWFLQIDKTKEQLLAKYNRTVQEMGEYLIKRDWENAFQYMKNKEVSERRVSILEQFRSYFEKNHGAITGVSVYGSIPHPEFEAMSLLVLEGEEGNNGIPFVWADEKEILGFRPMFTAYPFSCAAVQNAENHWVGYDPSSRVSVEIRIENNTIQLGEMELKKVD